MKQWLEPDSTRAEIGGMSRDVMVMEGIRELGSERADTLSLNCYECTKVHCVGWTSLPVSE